MAVSTSPAPAPRIGLLGGAFDPPHQTHVALAEAAGDQLALDQLRVLPTGEAWHKARALSPAVHRLAMARLAFADMPRAVIDPREIERPGPSYTIDTLRELKAEWPSATFFLLMGADQARALTGWRDWEEIARLAIICVADRPDDTQHASDWQASFPAGIPVRRIAMPLSPLSATQVRGQIAAGLAAENMVSGRVARYIADHHLYQSAR